MCIIEHISKHLAGSRYHEIARKYRVAHSIYLVSRNLRPPAIRLINDIILQQTSIMGNLYAGWESLHLFVLFTFFEDLVLKLRWIVKDRSRKHKHYGWSEVLALQIHVVQSWVLNRLKITLELWGFKVSDKEIYNVIYSELFGRD